MISFIIVFPMDTPLKGLCLDKLHSVFFPHHSSRKKKIGTTRDQRVRPVKNPTWFTKSISCQKFPDHFIRRFHFINRGSKCSCVIFEKLFEVFRG